MESSTRLMKFHLFNCDNTYKLDSVENLLRKMESKYDFKILVEKRYFRLQQISEMCETTIPKLQMDFAIFVIQAHESRLSINEDNAGIGYARFYRALLQATGKSLEDNYLRIRTEISVLINVIFGKSLFLGKLENVV